MIWMLEVNGFIQGIRNLPREVQEIAFEKGLMVHSVQAANGMNSVLHDNLMTS